MKTTVKLSILTCFLFLGIHTSYAQYTKYTNTQVLVNGQALKNPWAGGLNASIFNTIDLNGDGLKDLFVFEKQTGAPYRTYYKIRTFLNKGTANQVDYAYAPQYESKFPQDLAYWVLLVDFDCDGHEDIFTYSKWAGAMLVYHNDYTTTGGLSFSEYDTLVHSTYLGGLYANLYVSNVNQPVLRDVNGDGDLDVLTFYLLGSSIEYHENYAQEMYGRCDTLVYNQRKQCWGHVGLSPFSNSAVLNPNGCIFLTGNDSLSRKNNGGHSGSCMIGYDQNGDGDLDLINGDLLGDNLLYLENSGLPGVSDSIISQDSLFPVYDSSVLYQTFPAPYYFDADNDGKNDLVVSSCSEQYSENYNNNYFYKNVGSNSNHQFHFTKNRFLTDEMIDVGSGSNVTFHDVDGDGKMDLLVGNAGYFITDTSLNGGHFESAIAYYRNTSTGNTPEFTWVTSDFNNMQQYLLQNLKPTFGDLDGDGDEDMLLGNYSGNLYYFKKTGTALYVLDTNSINYQNIDVGTNSTPQLVDVDNDGLTDLIIGESLGRISYYHNTGTITNPVFTYVTNTFGGVNVSNPTYSFFGYSVPKLYSENGQHKLLVGSEHGRMFLYDNIDGNLGGTFNLVDSQAFGIYEPYRLTFDIAELNNDTFPEIIIGNFAGGLSYYSKDTTVAIIDTNPPSTELLIYPNPASETLTFEFKDKEIHTGNYSLYDATGRIVMQNNFSGTRKTLKINQLSKGFYTFHIRDEKNSYVKKIIIR